ncbi:hypothetical protein D9V86_00320 [Bacteroidetes/Chlorobi group bacterium ChocPot_Mid]|nr:MAG: hypothetical protein D9V86_00320 [Bacteroidetes/Chlorobi group bacterium ChocPot_Mid]
MQKVQYIRNRGKDERFSFWVSIPFYPPWRNGSIHTNTFDLHGSVKVYKSQFHYFARGEQGFDSYEPKPKYKTYPISLNSIFIRLGGMVRFIRYKVIDRQDEEVKSQFHFYPP